MVIVDVIQVDDDYRGVTVLVDVIQMNDEYRGVMVLVDVIQVDDARRHLSSSQQLVIESRQKLANNWQPISDHNDMSRDYGLHHASLMELARQSFLQHLYEKRRETESKIRYLVKKAELSIE